MNKSTYSKLFDKANKFYTINQVNGRVVKTVDGYPKYKSACDMLISSDHNEVEAYDYKSLNELFKQPDPQDLIDEEW